MLMGIATLATTAMLALRCLSMNVVRMASATIAVHVVVVALMDMAAMAAIVALWLCTLLSAIVVVVFAAYGRSLLTGGACADYARLVVARRQQHHWISLRMG